MKKTKLVAKTPLKAKTRIKAVQPLRKAVKPKVRKRTTLEQKTAQQLVKLADAVFSRYIRLRDSEQQPDGSWVGECVTCTRKLTVINNENKWVKSSQNGHYIGRGNHELRYSELNCHLQCAHCNAWLDKVTMIERYTEAIILLYGFDTLTELKNAPYRASSKKPELLQIIKDYTLQVDWYLTH